MLDTSLIIGILILLFGFPIGFFLARITQEELSQGQPWFKLLMIISLVGSIVSLIIRSDVLLFSFLFITIVTSRSLKLKKSKAR